MDDAHFLGGGGEDVMSHQPQKPKRIPTGMNLHTYCFEYKGQENAVMIFLHLHKRLIHVLHTAIIGHDIL